MPVVTQQSARQGTVVAAPPKTKQPTPREFAESKEGPVRGDDELSVMGRVQNGLRDFAANLFGDGDVRTGIEDFDWDQLANIPEDTILRFAFSPDDKAGLDLDGEGDMIEGIAEVLSIDNPTVELMTALAQSGKFSDLIWSGHGEEDGLMITGPDGDAITLGEEQLEGIFQGSSIDEAMLATCDSSGEAEDAFQDVGIETFAYENEVSDAAAMDDVREFAQGGDLEDIQASGGGGRRRGAQSDKVWDREIRNAMRLQREREAREAREREAAEAAEAARQAAAERAAQETARREAAQARAAEAGPGGRGGGHRR